MKAREQVEKAHAWITEHNQNDYAILGVEDAMALFRRLDELELARKVLCPYDIECDGVKGHDTLKCRWCLGKIPYGETEKKKEEPVWILTCSHGEGRCKDCKMSYRCKAPNKE